MSQDAYYQPKNSPIINTVVCVKNVWKTYTGNVPVLQNYSMTVEEGQIYGLLGSSGCGKSTVLSCIIGLQKWDSGTITVFGDDVRNGVSTQDIGYMPQEYALYSQLTVNEMLQFYAKLYALSDTKLKERLEQVNSLLTIDGYAPRRIGTLSGGETRRISLALTMLHDPKLLILDEPTVGLDPLLREKIWQQLFNLAYENKTTIIITTHYIEEVRRAHRVGIMRRGTLLAEENPNLLMDIHNTSLLEDVVLQMCKIDSLQSKHNATLTFPDLNSITIENEKTKSPIYWREVEDKPVKKVLTEPLQRIWAYNKVIWTNFIRQPIFIILLMILPPMQIITTGFVIGMPPTNIQLGVVNKDVLDRNGSCSYVVNETCYLEFLSCSMVTYINSSIYLRTVDFTTEEEARRAVERGDVMGYIEIPDNYSLHVIDRAMFGMHLENSTIDGSIVKLNLDMSDTIILYTALEVIQEGFAQFVKELTAECNIDLRQLDFPLHFHNPTYGNDEVTVRDYMLSSLLICVLFEVAYVAAPLVLISDMDIGIFERSQTAGLKLWEMMTSIFLVMITITVIQAIVCFITVILLLDIKVYGTIWEFTLICLVITFCNSALGLMIGIWLKDTLSIILSAIFLFPVLAMYTGVFRVLEVIPHPFRTLVFYVIPNVSVSEPLRWITSRGVGLTHPMVWPWPGVMVTFGWGVAFTIVCAFLLRRL